ncbi:MULTISPECIES: glycine zipper 2TM domain-containing protein [Massilia]|uniref:Glycine zipper 2TM domain-containing protein n=1 Tax=Massilia aurea TaxID=373040 RepID=A0A422QI96_9BURK|nr:MULTISPECIES: glycine zipper 2TM domain-containing protein [Massilia]MDY0964980.1 glycine zipper 2TM domain-containing protein [Massilia sp. CFBP9026]RNF29695.1 hypothetical protein NM04_16700 [Massilia aurea]
METTTTNRIHPLMAAAAASVIVVSLTGAAAITGLLPTSNSAPEPSMPLAAASPYAMPQAGMVQPNGYVAQPGQMAPVAANGQQLVPAMVPAMVPAHQVAYAQPVAQVQPEPTVIIKEKPVVKVVEKTRVVHAKPQPVRYEEPRYSQPAPAPAQQPNYVGIGTGAVIGGLIGNQIGGGNGKKLATVAGVIGGGIIGNEIANRNGR